MFKSTQIFLFILLSYIGHSQQVPNYVPQDGLVGWWSFNGNASDESSNGNNASVFGASLTTGSDGNNNSAYNFDGNDYIKVEHNSGLNFGNSDYTISVLAMRIGQNDFQHILSKFLNVFPYKGWYLRFEREYIAFSVGGFNDGSNWVGNGSVKSGALNSNKWYHVIGVFSPSTNQNKLYIDGELVDQSLTPEEPYSSDNSHDLMFGVHDPTGAPSGPGFLTGKNR